MSKSDGPSRIVSMDQFRGYTVAGMFLVNFLGSYAVIHPVLKHNNNYFSYADSIMPSFMFACGFSYRLTALRRLSQVGSSAYWRFIWRSLGLILVSLLIFGFDQEFHKWAELTTSGVWKFMVKLVKANLWEVLAIIGVAQLLILPVIAASKGIRLLTIAVFLAAHLVMTYFFNWNFVYGGPNWLDTMLGVEKSTAWDGGCFGLIQWAAIMLAGSLAYDAVVAAPGGRSAFRIVTVGILLMALGYGLSCLSMLYDGESPAGPAQSAASPVMPPLSKLSGRSLASLLVEAPLVQPPAPDQGRPINYWMMNKKIVSLPFVIFSTGLAAGLFGLFILVCDRTGWGIGLFRTFGQNALAAYLLHELAEHQVHTIVPGDSPLWYVMVGLALFYVVTYITVRYLEKQGVYVRL